jgi:Sec7-like guanine-nucleotide exchange factor
LDLAGIEFLKEKGVLRSPLDAHDVVEWLRTNPRLDKKKIGEYIIKSLPLALMTTCVCSRKNAKVLEAFVASFSFDGTRLDEALRMFLETFRLSGDAAEISMVLTHFSSPCTFIPNRETNQSLQVNGMRRIVDRSITWTRLTRSRTRSSC